MLSVLYVCRQYCFYVVSAICMLSVLFSCCQCYNMHVVSAVFMSSVLYACYQNYMYIRFSVRYRYQNYVYAYVVSYCFECCINVFSAKHNLVNSIQMLTVPYNKFLKLPFNGNSPKKRNRPEYPERLSPNSKANPTPPPSAIPRPPLPDSLFKIRHHIIEVNVQNSVSHHRSECSKIGITS